MLLGITLLTQFRFKVIDLIWTKQKFNKGSLLGLHNSKNLKGKRAIKS